MYWLPEETLLLPWVSYKDSWKQTNDQQIYYLTVPKWPKTNVQK